ncbi:MULTISPECIES: SCP2 sterol-binding domain-containing protein [Pseudofrankia]|uniref:SCP2 sterol-binding domain-containing protein n=1 Tax=Pseudofrankia TaxID=2994363 RepID=UPI000312CE45|nr:MULTISPECIES: SCP2 sterol-binding domain-containing protein [Pseudofrankia]OHV29735.1 alkyl sulfatase [Pseudofrankia sp. EUN1h]
MADRKQCETALHGLAARLDQLTARGGRPPRAPNRTLMCRLPDLGTSYVAELRGGCLRGIAEGAHASQITFTLSSDDLIAITEGRLSVTSAWTSGRLRVEASVRDLLRVRSLL